MPINKTIEHYESFENLQKLGDEAFEIENYENARDYFEKALILDPLNSGIYSRMGACWHALESMIRQKKTLKKLWILILKTPQLVLL